LVISDCQHFLGREVMLGDTYGWTENTLISHQNYLNLKCRHK